VTETVAAAPADVEPAWKLKKETRPPGYLTEEQFWTFNKLKHPLVQRHARYFHFLYDRDTGLYGNRPGNHWRFSRRKWMEAFITVQDKQTGAMVPFKLNEAQRALEAAVLRSERRGEPVRKNVLKARQQGISTYVCACLLYLQITSPNTRGLMMGHLKNSATVIQERMDGMIRLLRKGEDSHWKLSLDIDNREKVELSGPFHSVMLTWSAEAGDYRGDTLRFFHVIEPGEWIGVKAKAKANAVWKCVPKAAGTYVFVEGTAHGDTGFFAETWKAAWRRQEYGADELYSWTQSLFFPWFMHDRYRWSVVFGKPLPPDVAAEIKATLSDEEAQLLKRTYVRRGVGKVHADYDQLAWRRMTIAEDCQGSVDFFHQEYPATPEEAFQSTGLRFFSAKTIGEFREKYAGVPLWKGDTVDPEGERKMMRTLADIEGVR
jgi:hypothetical protein